MERPRALVRTSSLAAFDRTRRFAVLHCLNLKMSLRTLNNTPGLDETEQAGGGRRGACMVEGSHSPGDKTAIDTRRRVDRAFYLLGVRAPVCSEDDARLAAHTDEHRLRKNPVFCERRLLGFIRPADGTLHDYYENFAHVLN